MGTQENIVVVESMIAALQARDEAAYLACFHDDAVLRTAGVLPLQVQAVTQPAVRG
jgi:hypothetical protein